MTQNEQARLVRDAARRTDGDTFNLALVVNAATNEGEAKRLGENFVRMFKGFSDDDSPGREIGTGKYDYFIRVYRPDQSELALGFKAADSSRIVW